MYTVSNFHPLVFAWIIYFFTVILCDSDFLAPSFSLLFLVGFLQYEWAVCSYLFIYLFISVRINCHFTQWLTIPFYHYLFWCSNCPRIDWCECLCKLALRAFWNVSIILWLLSYFPTQKYAGIGHFSKETMSPSHFIR